MGPGEHYRGQRLVLSQLVGSLGDEQLSVPVPGCPAWRVRDLLAHLVGLPVDVCAGVMDNAGSPAWTQAQVDSREGRTSEELIEEWARVAPAFEDSLDDRGFLGWVFVYDVTLHGDDLREAVGLPLGTSETHAVVLDGIIDRARSRAEGVGRVMLRAGEREWQLGDGEPLATLTVPDEGELARVVAARRSDDAVRAMDWSGDPEPWIPVLPLFRSGRAQGV
jgi:uncharacterized protein (TIGR03083 family)